MRLNRQMIVDAFTTLQTLLLLPALLKISKNNSFVMDLYSYCKRRYWFTDFAYFLKFYKDDKEIIDDCLYKWLPPPDKEIFIRFLLKRYRGRKTANNQELAIIDDAFDKTEALYELYRDITQKTPAKFHLEFNGHEFVYNDFVYPDNPAHNADERRLMCCYAIAHAFFLTEYVMDGFNPKNGQVIFDCGAARGDTLLVFKGLYPDSPVHSFESSLENTECVRLNIHENNLKEAFCVNKFLYSKSGKHFMDRNTYKILSIKTENTDEIETLALDNYVEEHDITNIGLIKFDIEGGEQEALKGCVKTITKYWPLLYIPIYHLPSDVFAIPEFLKSLGKPMEFRLKWTEKKVWGVDCVLFVKFK